MANPTSPATLVMIHGFDPLAVEIPEVGTEPLRELSVLLPPFSVDWPFSGTAGKFLGDLFPDMYLTDSNPPRVSVLMRFPEGKTPAELSVFLVQLAEILKETWNAIQDLISDPEVWNAAQSLLNSASSAGQTVPRQEGKS